MASNPLHISLSPELQEFLQRQATKLGFESLDQYIESLVRTERRESARDRAEQLVLEGINSGEPVIADEAFWTRFKRELNSRIKLPKTA
jgi:Arc/MetJ-type ribon-helix-helix transcriptional regulator